MLFIDFFAGIGGMRSGLEKAGHKCVGFCELAVNIIFKTVDVPMEGVTRVEIDYGE